MTATPPAAEAVPASAAGGAAVRLHTPVGRAAPPGGPCGQDVATPADLSAADFGQAPTTGGATGHIPRRSGRGDRCRCRRQGAASVPVGPGAGAARHRCRGHRLRCTGGRGRWQRLVPVSVGRCRPRPWCRPQLLPGLGCRRSCTAIGPWCPLRRSRWWTVYVACGGSG